VVDVANVMGARADGWWRDRAAAALRLCRSVAELAARGVPASRMPSGPGAVGAPGAPGTQGAPGAPGAPAGWVLVLEGRARAAAASLTDVPPTVRVVTAPGSGDDAIVAEVASLAAAAEPCLVVTADRELRRRCVALGAGVAGPGWLIELL
jgi:hypothetical protein